MLSNAVSSFPAYLYVVPLVLLVVLFFSDPQSRSSASPCSRPPHRMTA